MNMKELGQFVGSFMWTLIWYCGRQINQSSAYFIRISV